MKAKKILGILLIMMLLVMTACANDNVSVTEDNDVSSVGEATDAQGPSEDEAVQPEPETQLSILDRNDGEPLELRAITPEGATAIAMLKMIYEQPTLVKDVKVGYETLNATDLLAGELMSEKADFAVVPTNLAAKLYNKGLPYTLASVNTHGNLYMITSDESLNSWEDLRGKDVYMIGQGLVPDLIFRYLATSNGLDPDVDMNVVYLAGTTEVAPTFLSGKSTITIMPEPVLSVVSTKEVPYKVLFDFQAEYEAASGQTGGFPQAGLFVKNSLIETYPEVVEAFIAELEASCTWVNENPDKAGEYATELEFSTPAPIIKKSMTGLNISHKSALEEKEALEALFNILLEASPESIGGSVPDEGFYLK